MYAIVDINGNQTKVTPDAVLEVPQLTGEPGHTFFEPRFKHLYEVESQRGMLGSLMTVGEACRKLARTRR